MKSVSVLGIDAAWTKENSSGVALLTREKAKWRCIKVAASYAEFTGNERAAALDAVNAARNSCGCWPEVVAVDIPLSYVKIRGRRSADQRISEDFGRYLCSTHSPSAKRPGPISEKLRDDLKEVGYKLVVDTAACPSLALIEVYPHPAIVRLLRIQQRLQYKVSRMRKYWPDETPKVRLKKLRSSWKCLHKALSRRINSLPDLVPSSLEGLSGKQQKAIEDQLDALVCAWVGAEWIEERAQAYGDSKATIWVPTTGAVG